MGHSLKIPFSLIRIKWENECPITIVLCLPPLNKWQNPGSKYSVQGKTTVSDSRTGDANALTPHSHMLLGNSTTNSPTWFVVIALLYLAYQCPLKLKGLPRNYSVKIFNIKIHFYLIAHKPSQYILWNGVSYQLSKHQIMKSKIW